MHLGDAQLMAQVRDVAFCGRGYERALACEGPLLFTRVCSERRWERGSTVGVALNPEGCLVLGGDDGAGMAPTDLVDLTAPPAQEEHARQ